MDWLTPEDSRIVRLESDVIAGHTCKLIETAGPPPPIDALRAHVDARLDTLPRLRCRLERDGGRLAWAPDDRFDISAHVLELPGPLDTAALRDAVAGLMTARLDRSRPLWTLHAARLADGAAAFALRLHHALADGSAALSIAARILWDAQAPVARPAPGSSAPPPGRWRRAQVVLRELVPASRRSLLDSRISPERRVAFAGAPLADVKRIEQAAGGGTSVNDVILSAVAGGLRRGLPDGDRLPRIRMKVPVGLHAPGDRLANHDSFMCVDADVAERDPLRRLHAISGQTRQRKLERDGEVLDRVMHRSRRAGRVLDRWALSPRVFALNVSNVRGPAGPLAVLDRPVASIHSVAEVAQHHALRVACLSAAGRVTFGLCADAAAVPALDAVAAGIEAELAALSP